MRIELDIDELILHGVPAADRYRVADAMKQEFARVFASQAVTQNLAEPKSIAVLDAGRVDVAPTVRPSVLGESIARSVFGKLVS